MTSSQNPTLLNDATMMRALAHPLRLRILALLSGEGPASVSTLANRLISCVICDGLDGPPGRRPRR